MSKCNGSNIFIVPNKYVNNLYKSQIYKVFIAQMILKNSVLCINNIVILCKY